MCVCVCVYALARAYTLEPAEKRQLIISHCQQTAEQDLVRRMEILNALMQHTFFKEKKEGRGGKENRTHNNKKTQEYQLRVYRMNSCPLLQCISFLNKLPSRHVG